MKFSEIESLNITQKSYCDYSFTERILPRTILFNLLHFNSVKFYVIRFGESGLRAFSSNRQIEDLLESKIFSWIQLRYRMWSVSAYKSEMLNLKERSALQLLSHRMIPITTFIDTQFFRISKIKFYIKSTFGDRHLIENSLFYICRNSL